MSLAEILSLKILLSIGAPMGSTLRQIFFFTFKKKNFFVCCVAPIRHRVTQWVRVDPPYERPLDSTRAVCITHIKNSDFFFDQF